MNEMIASFGEALLEAARLLLECMKVSGPIVVGLAGLYIGYVYNKRALRQRTHEEERKEIYKRLNSFYGPIQQLLVVSKDLYDLFASSRSPGFRTLDALLEGQEFEPNEEMLLEQIMEVTGEINKIILNNSGLVDDTTTRLLLAKASTHFYILHLAYYGDITGDIDRFRNYVYPLDLNNKIDEQIKRLQARLDTLNAM